MASQLRFEGPELESLLEQVRDELGADARIVEANRVRKGGIGGFFAREEFEVVVEGHGDDAVTVIREVRDEPATPAPASLLDLADAVSDNERDGATGIAESSPISTQTSDFGALLARLTRDLDDAAAQPQPQEPPAPAPAPEPPAAATHTYEPPRDTVTRAYEPADADVSALLRDAIDAQREATAATPPKPVPPTPEFMRTLIDLGLPKAFLPRTMSNAGARTTMLESLSQLPEPPELPETPGVVIAVVGQGTAPAALARRLANELDIDFDHIELATPRQGCDLATPEAAAERRLRWRRRPEPTIVVCSTGRSRRELAWARGILDHLEPTIVWAVVDASCKSVDIGDRLTQLGGVDVLAVDGMADTVSPAAVLELGVPVGRLDGRIASAITWTELLLERVPAEQLARTEVTP